jgi:uncharacterized membrane protein
MAQKKTEKPTWKTKIFGYKIQQVLPYILIVTALIGFTASFVLTVEHMSLLKDPNYNPSCSINPILSCGPVMASDTATTFGFPNPLMGIASFAAQALLGLMMLAGARMKSWFWKLWGLQVLGSVVFTLFLMQQSIFEIGAICIYCMTVWVALSVSAWYTLQYMLAEGHIGNAKSKTTKFVRKYHGDILLVWFLLVAGLILYEFWYFFGPKLGF